jgi:hypothetical protein
VNTRPQFAIVKRPSGADANQQVGPGTGEQVADTDEEKTNQDRDSARRDGARAAHIGECRQRECMQHQHKRIA